MSATPLSARDELVSVDPATLEVIGSVRADDPATLGEMVSEARMAQVTWARSSFAARRELLERVANLLLEAGEEIAATIVAETGKPVVEAYTSELFVCLDNLHWLARNAGRVLGRERLRVPQLYLPHKRAWLRYDPVGVVAVVSAWNFPLGVPLTQAASAVAAGNAAIVKPSELTPLCGAWVERLFREAGAPAGLVRVAQGAGDTVGEALVSARGVDKILFTGSTEAGRRIALRAAERLRPVTLELGGKDPMIVLDDAHLDRTVDGALWASFSNCGQICSGVERIYVEAGIHDAFLERLAARAQSLRIGAGTDPAVELGPLVSEEQRARVEGLVADALEHGATLVAGGGRPDTGLPGWFHEPTVLAGEPAQARIRGEEIFGPVVTVVKIDDAADGIARANASPYALGASVWSGHRGRAAAVAEQIDAGSVWVNDHAYSYGTCQAPWGGRKESGIGRTHSRHGLYALSHVTYVDADAGRLAAPWWYPYSANVADGFRGALGVLYGDGVTARAGAAWRHRGGLATLGRRALRR